MLSLKTVWFAHIFFYRIKIIILQKPKSSAGHASHSGPGWGGGAGCDPSPWFGVLCIPNSALPQAGVGAEPKSRPGPQRGISISYTHVVPRPRFPSLKRSHPKHNTKIQSQARPARSKPCEGVGRAPQDVFLQDKDFHPLF